MEATVSILREGERAKVGAEVLRHKTNVAAHRDRTVTEISERSATLLAILDRMQAETETFTADDIADVQSILAYQVDTTVEAVKLILGDDPSPLIPILTAAGYTVTAPE